MSEKANPAVATAHQAPAQIAVVPQNRPQRDLILSNKRSGLIVAVPVGAKLVDLFEAYEKKARFCVIMRIVISMSSSYRLNAKSSSGRTRIFSALAHPISDTDPRTRINTHPLRVFTLPTNPFSSPARLPESEKTTRKKELIWQEESAHNPHHFFFQVVGDSKRANPSGIQLSVIVVSSGCSGSVLLDKWTGAGGTANWSKSSRSLRSPRSK